MATKKSKKIEAVKFNDGKPRISLVLECNEAVAGAAEAMEYGSGKYGRKNFMQGDGLPLTELADAALRHLSSWLSGEEIDIESGVDHIDCFVASALMLSQLDKTRSNDDRVKV